MTDKFQALEVTLNNLIGQPCWSVLVPDGLENGLSLSLGERIKRGIPLDAPSLTAEQRQYIGAYELTIADCTWRLDAPEVIVTSWSDETAIQRERLSYLLDQTVSNWEITWPGLDLTLHFDNSLSLRLFCDQTDPDESGENYTLLTPTLLFNVGVRSQLHVSARPEA
jgi:hypothetical protein